MLFEFIIKIDSVILNVFFNKSDTSKYISSGKTVIMCIDDKNVVKRIVTYLDILNDVIITNENEIVKNKINIINKYFDNVNISLEKDYSDRDRFIFVWNH